MAVPELHYLQCVQFKDASEDIKRTIEALNKPASGTTGNTSVSGNCAELRTATGVDYLEFLRVPDWLKVAVVRDPKERLVSTFLDKCARRRSAKSDPWLVTPNLRPTCEFWRFASLWGNGSVIGMSQPPSNDTSLEELMNPLVIFRVRELLFSAMEERAPELFAEYVESLLADRVIVESWRGPLNEKCKANHHWMPQTCHCGYADPEVRAHYTFIWMHDLSMEHLTAEIIDKLTEAGRPPELVEALRRAFQWNFGNEKLLQRRKKIHGTSATEVMDSYVTEELEGKIREAYALDYELLGWVWDQRERPGESFTLRPGLT